MMSVCQLSVKVLAKPPLGFTQEAFIPIFHEWIRKRTLDDELCIDVTDYSHVPDGPGVMLIAHEAHYGLDEGGGQLGLLYSKKRDEPAPIGEKLPKALAQAVKAARHIEAEPTSSLSFRTDAFEIRVQSRLHAQNDAETFEALAPEVKAAFAALHPGSEISVARLSDDPRNAFGLRVEISEPASLDALRDRLTT